MPTPGLDAISPSPGAQLAFPTATRGRSHHLSQLTTLHSRKAAPGWLILVLQGIAHALYLGGAQYARAETERREEGGSGAGDRRMKGEIDKLFTA